MIEQDHDRDQDIFQFLAHYVTPARTSFMEALTWCASSTFMQIGYGLLVAGYLIAKNWKRAIEIGVIGLGGWIINFLMKLGFERERPPNPLIAPLKNFSFPSGHATSAFIFYGLIVYLVWKTKLPRIFKIVAAVILISFALLIGFSRIYLRVHYTTDVVAGFCIGLAWLGLAIWMMERTKEKADVEVSHKPKRKGS
jgi:membrane-associated phospholipid phosphatase